MTPHPSRHLLSLTFAVATQFMAVTFLLPLLPTLGIRSPWFESVFYLAHIVALPLLGRLADRFGTRKVLTLSLLGELTAFSLLLLPWTTVTVVIARVISGASSAILPVCFVFIRRHTKQDHELSRNIAVIMLGITAGSGLGALLSGIFFEEIRIAVGIVIGMSLTALSFLWTLPDEKKTVSTIPDPAKTKLQPWQQIRASRGILTMAGVFLFVSTGFFLYRTLLPFRFVEAEATGFGLAILSLGVSIAQTWLVLKPTRISSSLADYLGSLLIVEAGFVMGMLHTNFLLPSLFLVGVGIGSADVFGGSALARLTKKEKAGSSAGVVFGIGALGKLMGPSLAVLFVASPLTGSLFAVLFTLLGLLTGFFLMIRKE